MSPCHYFHTAQGRAAEVKQSVNVDKDSDKPGKTTTTTITTATPATSRVVYFNYISLVHISLPVYDEEKNLSYRICYFL